jgi:NAD(P)-dependent dehydrogenase (short-subunit alcohol dehydrogenase family)
LAIDLAKSGWDLVVDSRRQDALDELGTEVAGLGVHVDRIVGDIADEAHRAELIRAAGRRRFLDLLVNNASSLGPSPLPKLDVYPLDDLRRVYEVNVVAPLALLQAALPLLRRSNGVVVSLSSDAAVEAYEGWGGYGSSKAALDQVQRVLGAEEPEVRVYAFDPGDMRTEMHQAAFPGEDISDRPDPESVVPALRRLLASDVPSGRYTAKEWGSP